MAAEARGRQRRRQPHRQPHRQPRRRRLSAALTLAVAATVLVPSSGCPAAGAAEPVPVAAESLSGLLTRLQRLYREAEAAGETYNAADQELKALAAETRRLTGDLARTRDALARSRAAAGRLARAQYQGRTELPAAALRLLFARDPRRALDQEHTVLRAARQQAAAVTRLESGEKRADALATASRRALDRQQSLLARQRQARDTARLRLLEVAQTLADLPPERLAALAALEDSRTAEAQQNLPAALSSEHNHPSAAGGAALAYAAEQLGKPYELGATGPDAFDASGLAYRAWATAGRPIPRTGQAQWRTLPKVPLARLRPGDLVLYGPDATHVALYAGAGQVLHAPHPGAPVELSPLAARPTLGAARPDTDSPALTTYTPPPPLTTP
ncbi:C40 family peptidase [Streptomyces sp. TRM64462]|uniref:C40 family peptidase n=1 Tax=Streptomyces sp. TRM64462 TaxID=2741726 RepID=UPI0015864880|nr:C40 family peptidase [Streptomyces sp. TRM64462]